MCDPAEGICIIPNTEETSSAVTAQNTEKKIKIIYFSDPLCSACWGVEPILRKLKLEYADSFEIEYNMGGLLPGWELMDGRVTPEKIAENSAKMSELYQMPMNADVWIKDPPSSSYPPSIAFKAAQIQDKNKAAVFLRKLREDLYVKGINIAKWENIQQAALLCSLDVNKLRSDYKHEAEKIFQDDLLMAQKMGVRGFPCFIFTNSNDLKETLYGIRPYDEFEAVLNRLDSRIVKQKYSGNHQSLFTVFNSMTTWEFAVMSGLSFLQAQEILNDLEEKKEIISLNTETGILWTRDE
ncbi:hypothetical protein AAFH68_17060 [Flavobacterium sp. CGRL1]